MIEYLKTKAARDKMAKGTLLKDFIKCGFFKNVELGDKLAQRKDAFSKVKTKSAEAEVLREKILQNLGEQLKSIEKAHAERENRAKSGVLMGDIPHADYFSGEDEMDKNYSGLLSEFKAKLSPRQAGAIDQILINAETLKRIEKISRIADHLHGDVEGAEKFEIEKLKKRLAAKTVKLSEEQLRLFEMFR